MANTYTQLLVQIVFAVKGRQCFINEKNREQVEKYICGIISNKQSKPLAIYCNPDHCHVLIGLHPSHSISDMARDIKASSSKYINENHWITGRFEWQEAMVLLRIHDRNLIRWYNIFETNLRTTAEYHFEKNM